MKAFQLIDTLTEDSMTGQTAVCAITGINIKFNLPMIEGTYLEYNNPLSIYSNIVSLSKLPYKTHLSKYPVNILAGCLLTALHKYELLDDKLSSAHRNIILQAIPHFLLIDTMRFIVSLTKREAKNLARFSLESTLDTKQNEKCAFNIVKNWLAESRAIVYPVSSTSTNNTATEKDNAREYGIKLLQTRITERKERSVPVTIIMKDNKDAMKILINEGIADSIFPSKIVPLLKLLGTTNNLANLDDNLRAKFTKTLEKIDHLLISKITKLINHKVYSSAGKDLLDRHHSIKSGEIGITNTISEHSDYAPSKPKTIAEILEAKRKEFTNND